MRYLLNKYTDRVFYRSILPLLLSLLGLNSWCRACIDAEMGTGLRGRHSLQDLPEAGHTHVCAQHVRIATQPKKGSIAIEPKKGQ